MASDPAPISSVSATSAYARVDGLVPVVTPIATIQPVQNRFLVDQNAGHEKNTAVQTKKSSPDFLNQETSYSSEKSSRSPGGLLGAFTAFMTRLFAQGIDAAPQTSPQIAKNSTLAYSTVQGRTQNPNSKMTILAPEYQPLASGKVIDLVI